MLISLSKLNGYSIKAEDGNIGEIKDFYFDDHSWLIRYAIVDTRKWLPGRRVIIPPSEFKDVDTSEETFAVRMTKKEIENGPDIGTAETVSRQREKDIADYYSWPVYWNAGTPIPPLVQGKYNDNTDSETDEITQVDLTNRESELRSVDEITGYTIKAADGELGGIDDIVVDDRDWSIKFIILDTRKWFPGKKVAIESKDIKWISWIEERVSVKFTKDEIKNKPEFSMLDHNI